MIAAMPWARRFCEGTLARWVAVACVLLLLWARKPDAFQNPQLWAEDGSIFFSQQVQQGARAHLEPYAGTFNEVPRLVVSFAALFPHRHAPALYNGAALLVTLALVLKLFSPRLALPCPLLFALAVALAPHPGGEVFVCLTNVQWVLALFLVAVVLQRSPETRAQAFGDGCVVLLAGLTGPFLFFALPLLALKAWRHRSRLELPVLGIGAAVATVQLWALAHSSIEAPPPLDPAPGVWGRLLGPKLVGTLFLGPRLPYTLEPALLILAGLLLLGGIVWALRRSPAALEKAGFCLLFALAVIAAAFTKFAEGPGHLVPAEAGARYFYLPAVLLAWCLLLVTAHAGRWPRVLASAALLAMLASSLLSGFRSPPLEDLGWEEQAARIGGPERDVWIPIHPQGWMIHLTQ